MKCTVLRTNLCDVLLLQTESELVEILGSLGCLGFEDALLSQDEVRIADILPLWLCFAFDSQAVPGLVSETLE